MMDALTIPRRYRGARLTVGGDALKAAEGDHLAIVITAAAVALLPLLRPQGPANIAPVDALIALALSSSLLWAGMSGKPWRFAYTFPVALLVVGGALGALAGPVPTGGLIALLQDLWLLAWCICIANVCRTPRALAIVLRTWVWSSMVWAVLLLAGEFTGSTYLAGIQSNEGGRTSLTFGDANYSAHYFFLSMMIIAATRYPRHRVARVLMYMILLPPWALSGSNSGVIELLIGIAVIALVAVYRRSGLLPTVAAACSLLIIGALLVPRFPLARIQTAAHDSHYRVLRDWVGRSEKTFGQRKELIHESIGLFYTGGPFGEGPTSTIHRLTTTQAPFPREAHDDYLAALVERGFLGAIGMILLVGSVFVRAGSIIRKPLSPAFAEVVPRAGPILAAVVGTFVFATVYEVLHARHVWALFGIVAALFLWGRE